MRFAHAIPAALAAAFVIVSANAAWAVKTEIVVRVIAKDAKFIGHADTGGVMVTLRDAQTGEVLAQGVTEGGNGKTEKIMMTGKARRDDMTDGGSKFSATLDLTRPRLIQVTATGPVIPKDTALTVTSTQWVVPGKPVNGGNGWMLELPGFAIAYIDPPPKSVTVPDGKPFSFPIRVRVAMQCNCPIEPGGLWDSNKIEIAAMLEKDGKSSAPVKLAYDGHESEFGGAITLPELGSYMLDVYAYDPASGNTGVLQVPVSALSPKAYPPPVPEPGPARGYGG